MTRILKILIGRNAASADEIKADICSILARVLAYKIHVLEEHTLVVFLNEVALLEFPKKVTGSIAGVDNVRSEELTPTEALVAIEEVEGLDYLEEILSDKSTNSDPVENLIPTVNTDPAKQHDKDNENVRNDHLLWIP